MVRACCDTLEEHGIDSHLDSCRHSPPKRYTAADLARAVEAERELLMRMMRDVVQRARRNGDAFTVDEYIAGIEADYDVTRLRARRSKT